MRSRKNKICLFCLTSLISTSGVDGVGRGVLIIPSRGAAGAVGALVDLAALLHLGLLLDLAEPGSDGALVDFPPAQASNKTNGSEDFLALDGLEVGAGVAIVNFTAAAAFQ